MSSWRLEKQQGRMPWQEAVAMLAGCTCVWMDLDGLHVGPAPAEAPIATHLWGWSDGRYLRVRLDDEDAYVGVLHESPADSVAGDEVRVLPRPATMRSPEHTGIQELDIELLEIPGPAPVTFVRPAR